MGKKRKKPKKRSASQDSRSSKPVERIVDIPEQAWGKWAMLALLTLVGVVYLLTLKRTVEGGDSGEMVITAYTWGIAHPPGYPLYCFLGKLFSFFPFGNVAVRLNLFSALCNLGAVYFLMQSMRIMTRNVWPALVAGAAFALYPFVWRYAVIAEVFALNNLIGAVLIYLFVQHIVQRDDQRNLYLGALTIGLGISHHHTIIFVAFPLVVGLLLFERNRFLNLNLFLKLVGCGILGLTPYLYMPLAAQFDPINSWGDHHSLSGIINHFLRDDYGTFSLAVEGETRFWGSLAYYFGKSFENYAWIGGGFFLLGLFAVKFHRQWQRKQVMAFSWLVFAFFFYVVIFHYLSNITQYLDPENDLGPMYFEIVLRFWLLPHLILCMIIALGVSALAGRLPHAQKLSPILYVSATLLLFAGQALVHYKMEDQSDKAFVYQQGKDTLDALPQDALVFISGDTLTNSIRYLQYGEGYRQDVIVINRQMLKRNWYKRTLNANFPAVTIPGDSFGYDGFHFHNLFDANFSKFPIYMSHVKETDAYEMQDVKWKEQYQTYPGIHVELLTRSGPIMSESYKVDVKEHLPNIEDLSSRKPYSPEGSWEVISWRANWEVHHNFARQLVLEAMQSGNDRSRLEEAINILEKVVKTIDKPKPQYYKDLGLAYSKMTIYNASYNQKTKEAWSKYLENPIANDKDNSEIQKIVSRL